jgi:hypothetical protein
MVIENSLIATLVKLNRSPGDGGQKTREGDMGRQVKCAA